MSATVYTMVCRRDYELSRVCLGSFNKTDASGHRLTLVSDNSLDLGELRDFAGILGADYVQGASLIEGALDNLGSNYKYCSAYLGEHVFALKLIALPVLCPSGVKYIDSDIYFSRPNSGLYNAIETDYVFMMGGNSAYSAGLTRMKFKYGCDVGFNVNAGMFAFGANLYDLDFVEWFLSKDDLRSRPFLVEQTCWACLAGRAGFMYWDPLRFFCSESGRLHASFDTVGYHFVGRAHKASALEFIASIKDRVSDESVLVERVKGRSVSVSDIARRFLRRKLG